MDKAVGHRTRPGNGAFGGGIGEAHGGCGLTPAHGHAARADLFGGPGCGFIHLDALFGHQDQRGGACLAHAAGDIDPHAARAHHLLEILAVVGGAIGRGIRVFGGQLALGAARGNGGLEVFDVGTAPRRIRIGEPGIRGVEKAVGIRGVRQEPQIGTGRFGGGFDGAALGRGVGRARLGRGLGGSCLGRIVRSVRAKCRADGTEDGFVRIGICIGRGRGCGLCRGGRRGGRCRGLRHGCDRRGDGRVVICRRIRLFEIILGEGFGRGAGGNGCGGGRVGGVRFLDFGCVGRGMADLGQPLGNRGAIHRGRVVEKAVIVEIGGLVPVIGCGEDRGRFLVGEACVVRVGFVFVLRDSFRRGLVRFVVAIRILDGCESEGVARVLRRFGCGGGGRLLDGLCDRLLVTGEGGRDGGQRVVACGPDVEVLFGGFDRRFGSRFGVGRRGDCVIRGGVFRLLYCLGRVGLCGCVVIGVLRRFAQVDGRGGFGFGGGFRLRGRRFGDRLGRWVARWFGPGDSGGCGNGAGCSGCSGGRCLIGMLAQQEAGFHHPRLDPALDRRLGDAMQHLGVGGWWFRAEIPILGCEVSEVFRNGLHRVERVLEPFQRAGEGAIGHCEDFVRVAHGSQPVLLDRTGPDVLTCCSVSAKVIPHKGDGNWAFRRRIFPIWATMCRSMRRLFPPRRG